MTNLGIAWQWYQIMGMYETLIILEVDTGQMTVWNNPINVYYKNLSLTSTTSILTVSKVYGE